MISSHWPPDIWIIVKTFALAGTILAAVIGWWAANEWLKASRIEVHRIEPTAASMDDAPALHILGNTVQNDLILEAIRASAALNARAAKLTAIAVIIGAAAAVLAAL